ncbi:unnamed protein product [Phytomonas sp. Hart1]|nr:unnamed protein product [Phytomonas sp. Hart1]|eukprot:CCW68388.1 unnamed protein product [Phytomonas sp. isolate Hart1]
MFLENPLNGYFGDLPYVGPVESSAFFQLVSEARLHKLSEKMIINPREIDYFVHPKSKLYSSIKFNHRQSSSKIIKTTIYPELKNNFHSISSFNRGSSPKIIHIKESVSRIFKPNTDTNLTNIVGLDFYGIQKIWSELIKFIFGYEPDTNLYFAIPNIDNYLQDELGTGDFLLSLLLIGVASIVDFVVSRELNVGRIKNVSLELTVFSNNFGKSIADTLEFFCENTLNLSVSRSFCSPDEKNIFYQNLFTEIPSLTISSLNELIENVRSRCVDRHEELCDLNFSENESPTFAPVILVIVPLLNSIRINLKKSLLDSYSYEPITVLSDMDWDATILDQKTPIIFFCSSAWILEQARFPKYDQLLCKLNIKTILHCGFIEFKLTIEEELAETITFIKFLNQSSFDISFVKHLPQSFSENAAYPSRMNAIEVAGNTILLMFRLFMMRYSPVSEQPFFTFPRNIFFSESAWRLYLKCVPILSLGGLIKATYDHSDWPIVELTVLGRFISLRFRLTENGTEGPELSLIDSKIVVWSHLLRQSYSDTCSLIQERYIFKDWINCNVKKFCDTYKMILSEGSTSRFQSLIRQLSNFGINDLNDTKRTHLILSSPSGRRGPIPFQLSDRRVTTCRGWFDKAPLQIGLVSEKRSVETFCPPPSSLYSEVEVASKGSIFRIQCPTEVSYPIIVAYFILHISLHNNGIFVESVDAVPPVPLPNSILQSHTMLTVLKDPDLDNVGLWLDGIMCDAALAPSDPSMLVNLLLKGQHFIELCERVPFTRKRKLPKTEPKVNCNLATSGVFAGVTPRSLIESDTIEEFINLVGTIGREKAESTFRRKKGFGFLDPDHYLYPYYLHLLSKGI